MVFVLSQDSGTQRQYSDESVFNNIKTPIFNQDNKPLNIFSTKPFSKKTAATARTASSGSEEAFNEKVTPRAGTMFVDTKSTLTSPGRNRTNGAPQGGIRSSQLKSSISLNIDVSPSVVQQSELDKPIGSESENFQNMSPLSHHSIVEEHSTTSNTQSQDTRTNIPSLEFTLSETDTNSNVPFPLASEREPYFDDFEVDEGVGETEMSAANSFHNNKLPVAHHSRSCTTSTGSSSSVVNSEALGSIEQREMERIRHKMLQAQSSSSSLSSSNMTVLNKPSCISTTHDTHVHSSTAGFSPMTEDSAYMLGDTLIHQVNSNKSSPFLSSTSSQKSPYTMGDSMTAFPPPLPMARSHSGHSHHSQLSHQSHSHSQVRRVSESSMVSGPSFQKQNDDDEEEEVRQENHFPDGIMAPSSTRRGVLDSSSDEEEDDPDTTNRVSLTRSEINCHSDINSDTNSDVEDSEYFTDMGPTQDLLQEFDDENPRFSSDSVYEVMPSSRLTNISVVSTSSTH